MTTQDATALRSAKLGAAVQAEIQAAVQQCVFNAVSRGYTMEELGANHLHGPEHFKQVADGGPITFNAAVEVARSCGYRLSIRIEILDDETHGDPAYLTTPFERAREYLQGVFKDAPIDKIEDTVRGVLTHYFDQMREKGYYVGQRIGS